MKDRQLIIDFCTLITKNTGIVIREQDRNSLEKKILTRMKDLKFISLEYYYNLLEANDFQSYQEWEKLVTLLTNNESYFFRNRQQLNILRDCVLPEIIDRHQNDRTIRICSLGCSTGEEPYSLAILIQEIIPNFWQWNITILGIDIDRQALIEAKKGIYNPWSFRGVSELIKQKYFEKVKNQYHLSPEIKKMVKFQAVNLVKDAFPQAHTQLKEMDLMVCRNVFIYFEEEAIAQVLKKIYYTLKPSGYFLAGHTELSGHNLKNFEAKVFPESIIYQKGNSSVRDRHSINFSQLPSFTNQINKGAEGREQGSQEQRKRGVLERRSRVAGSREQGTDYIKIDETTLFQEIETLIESKKYNLAIEKINQILHLKNNCFKANYLMAQIYANLRKYAEVDRYCQQAIASDAFSVIPHYLLAQIAEEQGNKEEAKLIFKKIIYLEPTSIAAYIDLSYLYQQEGDLERAVKMQREALNLLKQLPSHTKIPEKGNSTAAELILQLETDS